MLDPEIVIQSKEVEMQFIRQWQIYDYTDYNEAYDETSKAHISTKRVCTNKGDDAAPNIRCRWVVRKFRNGEDVVFAATAPY